MQDRVNYRFWDTKEQVMLDWDCICQTAFNCTRKEGNEIQRYGLMYFVFTTPQRFIPLLCTGRKDKNGKLIFEEDFVIEKLDGFKDCKKVVYWIEDTMTGFNLNSEGEYEVIGNIYENPELLEENNAQKIM